MRNFLFIFCILVCFKLSSQGIAAYTDLRGYFNVFDNGNTTELEYNLPQSYQVGGNSVAYIDYNSNFKIYYNGNDTTVYIGPVNKYVATHNLVFYVIGGQIRVFDRGDVRTLSTYPGTYAVGDSLVAYSDSLYKAFYVYYNHDKFTLENNLGLYPLMSFQASNNTLAYITYQREFKIFWNGSVRKIFTLSPGFGLDYKTGSNIVAFLSGPSNGLSVFYKGNTFNVSNVPVKTYQTGDDMVAYEDQNGLHAFYSGMKYDLCSAYEFNYKISDSVIVYYTPGYFKVFNRGKITVLANYLPDEYALDNNTVAWINQQGGLQAFYNDNTYDLTGFDRVSFKLEGNTLWFKSQTSPNKVFLCGKTY